MSPQELVVHFRVKSGLVEVWRGRGLSKTGAVRAIGIVLAEFGPQSWLAPDIGELVDI